MATTDRTTVNGVDTAALTDAVEAITEDLAVGVFSFRAETEWSEALRSATHIQEFEQAGAPVESPEFVIEGDEPEQILGDRTAPNAVELLLSALGSCLSVGYAANAAAMGIDLDSLRIEMEGDVDLRGFLGLSADVRPGYDSIRCTVSIDSDATDAELDALREHVESTSPLVDIITNEVPLETRLVTD
ncbi:MAG: OsmC family protein [Halohasta sp.]